jgi:hypothetical protein
MGANRLAVRVAARRVSLAGVLFFVLATCSTYLAPGTAVAQMNPTGPAWHARIVVAGQFYGVLGAAGSLYAVREPSHGQTSLGTRLVRVDPLSGAIVAVSRVLPGLSNPQFDTGAIWVTSEVAGATSLGHVRWVLSEIDKTSLHLVSQLRLPSSTTGATNLVGGTGGPLWEFGTFGLDQCVVRQVDIAGKGPTINASIHLSNVPCAGATLDREGQYLYVATSQGSSDWIYKLNAHTGASFGRVAFAAPGLGFSMVATSSHLWVAGGPPGANGALLFFSTTPLKVLAHNDTGETTGSTLPVFGQFPVVDYSGGRVWVGSDANLACFSPDSPNELALVSQGPPTPLVTDSFTVIAGQTWANSSPGSPPSGLVRITPPKRCRS